MTFVPDVSTRVNPTPFSTSDQVSVALLWFAFFAQWMTVVPIIVPDQVATILGNDAANKEGISGSIIALGGFASLVVSPLAGALSDRLRAPRGRRRPFLIAGILGSCVALALMIPFGLGSSLLLYAGAFLMLQIWWNLGAGAYTGLVPDVVPTRERGAASGWINVMSILGTVAGSSLLVIAYKPGRPAYMMSIFIVINLVCLVVTLARVREPAAAGDAHPFDLGRFVRSFYLDPRLHQNFYWVLITRLVANMGIWSIFTFLLFYVQDVIGIVNPTRILPALLGVGAVVAIPASMLGVRLAARYGIVEVVRATSWIMAAAAICYVLIALRPSLIVLIPVVIVFSASYGAYQAVDWALALAVLPSSSGAGKDMGIWHVSMVLPQIVGPATTGWLISGLKAAVSANVAYTVAFGIAALWFVLASLLVVRVRLAKPA
jgi:Na+/melibiose symporter-like transporter